MALLLLSFLAGALTVLAPCILPLLPIVLGGSIADAQNKRRPFVIVISLGVSVFLFTFILKVSTVFIGVPQAFWTYFSAVIIAVFGLALLFPTQWDKLVAKLPFLHTGGNTLLAKGYQSKGAWWGDIAIGVALGPIFTTCSPTYFLVLATVLPVSFIKGSAYILAYVLGLAIVLLAIAKLGQKLIGKLNWAANPEGWFKRGLGVLFLLVALAIAMGWDKQLETSLLNGGYLDTTKIEQRISEALNGSAQTFTGAVATGMQNTDAAGNTILGPYVEFKDPSGFVNSAPFQMKDLIGKKVVLLDFMTYSCINCQRTFPALNKWDEDYKDQGLEVIGIHTPEFAFEKNITNVQNAAKEFGIQFPLVLDNDYGTWNAWGNQYWPHQFLIDIDGNVVYHHIGEGGDDETQAEIVKLLNQRKQALGETGTVSADANIPTAVVPQAESPETYFGSARNEYFGNGTPGQPGEKTYTLPSKIDPAMFYLGGSWNIIDEYAENTAANAQLEFNFTSKEVYIVAEAPTPVAATVLIDGKPIDAAHAGADVKNGVVTIGESRLYHLYTSDGPSTHIIELIFKDKGGRIYTFTFG